MRRSFALALALLVCAAPFAGLRGDDAGDARTIVQRAFEAHGGYERLAKLKSFVRHAKGEIYSFGGAVPATFDTSTNLPSQCRWSFELDNGMQKIPISLAINGDKGWQSGMGGVKEMTKQQFDEQRDESYLLWVTTLAPLRDGFTLTALPEIKIANEPAVGIKATRKDQADIKLYFDKKTGLLVKAERKGKEAGVDMTKEYLYSDFKEFDRIKLPTKQLEIKNGKRDAEWTISDYKFSKVDDAVFTKP